MKNNFLLLLAVLLLSQVSHANETEISPTEENLQQITTSVKAPRRLSIKAMSMGVNKAIKAIEQDPFSDDSVWNLGYFKREPEVANLITKFLAGEYAQKAKLLNISGINKDQIIKKLLAEGFEKREAEGRVDGLLGRSKDREFQDSGEIFIHADGSMVRVKEQSATRKHRPQPYIIKAALKNPTGPVTWQNEAFKISKDGYAVPKSPKQNHGMKTHAPGSSGRDEDKGWIDLVMEEVHIDITK